MIESGFVDNLQLVWPRWASIFPRLPPPSQHAYAPVAARSLTLSMCSMLSKVWAAVGADDMIGVLVPTLSGGNAPPSRNAHSSAALFWQAPL